MTIPEVSTMEGDWNSIISPYKRVVVLFFATWSPYDKKLATSLEILVPEFNDEIEFLRADVDEIDEQGTKFLKSISLYTVPTLVLFKDGKIQELSVGYLEQEKLRELLMSWAQI